MAVKDGHVRTASSTYTYGNADWPDLLTAFNGKSITYDAIGNPRPTALGPMPGSTAASWRL
ncbi:MAG: hypothetical protein ACLR5H_10870 [Oscillospiraceae bacterium]